MNHWNFIIAAYGLTGVGTLGILIMSFAGMRRAEKAVATLDQDK